MAPLVGVNPYWGPQFRRHWGDVHAQVPRDWCAGLDEGSLSRRTHFDVDDPLGSAAVDGESDRGSWERHGYLVNHARTIGTTRRWRDSRHTDKLVTDLEDSRSWTSRNHAEHRWFWRRTGSR